MAITEEGKQRYNAVVRQNSLENTVRIGSFNICTYKRKDRATIQFAMELMMDNYIDIAGIQEFGTFRDFNAIEASKIPSVFDYVTDNPSFNADNGRYGNAIVSHHKFYDNYGSMYDAHYTTPSGYMIISTIINGKKLWMYNTHLEAYSGTTNSAQFNELAKDIKGLMESNPNDYFVVVADFNSREQNGDYHKLRDIGLRESLPTTGIDNIFYSSNMSLLDTRVVATPDWVTDHELVFAELKMN